MTAGNDGNATPMTDIHDIRPLVEMGPDWQWLYWVLAALVLAGIVLMVWRLWRRRKKPVLAAPAPPPVPPDAEACQALDLLESRAGINGKQYYFRLSAILRRYLERRYAFPAAEMTTEELLPCIDRLPLGSGLSQRFKALCRFADPVKFAGAGADRDRMRDHMAFARSFIRQTTADAEETRNTTGAEAPDAVQGAAVATPPPQ